MSILVSVVVHNIFVVCCLACRPASFLLCSWFLCVGICTCLAQDRPTRQKIDSSSILSPFDLSSRCSVFRRRRLRCFDLRPTPPAPPSVSSAGEEGAPSADRASSNCYHSRRRLRLQPRRGRPRRRRRVAVTVLPPPSPPPSTGQPLPQPTSTIRNEEEEEVVVVGGGEAENNIVKSGSARGGRYSPTPSFAFTTWAGPTTPSRRGRSTRDSPPRTSD
jgi:hypothetical protein